ncbi:Uma2 family endonuclease [soil metagenome]
MPMPAAAREWRPDEVRALQDEEGNTRYELVDGELIVTPAPSVSHQRIVRELLMLLVPFVRREQFGEVFSSPADVALERASVLQPDVFVVPKALKVERWSDVSDLLLAIEVVSPSTARHDRITKRRFLQRHRVPEYWILDSDARLVEQWRPDDTRPEIVTEQLRWEPVPGSAVLSIDLPTLFAGEPFTR